MTRFVVAALIAVSAYAIRKEMNQKSMNAMSEEHLLDIPFVPEINDELEGKTVGEKEESKSCIHGKFWAGAERGCIVCPSGHYCPEGTMDEAFPCPSGTYNDMQGQWNCTICPPGNFCPEKSSVATLCPLGKFNAYYGMDRCMPCPVGHRCSMEGLMQPESCTAGKWQDEFGSAACMDCTPGHFCVDGTVQPTACPDGQFNPSENATSREQCISCPAGNYCLQGAKEPWACPPGTYQEFTGSTKCSDCPPGTECWQPEMMAAIPCPAGSFEVDGQCMTTPPGSYSSAGNTEPKFCQAGFFSFAGASACTECPTGTFCAMGSSEPILCPQGFFNPQQGATGFYDCKFCNAGTYCPSGASVEMTCPAGTTSFPGSATESDCYQTEVEEAQEEAELQGEQALAENAKSTEQPKPVEK